MVSLLALLLVVNAAAWAEARLFIYPDCLAAIKRGDRSCLDSASDGDSELDGDGNGNGDDEVKSIIRDRQKIFICGMKSGLSANIAGGEDTAPGDWPWMARMIYKRDDEWCAGTLVSDRHVVTAAHCVAQKTPDFVRLGDSDLTRDYDCLEPGTCRGEASCYEAEECAPRHLDIRIRDIQKHERFKMCEDGSCFPKFDIALLTLETSVPLSDFIQPLCLPEPGSTQNETNLVVAGWGNTAEKAGVYKPANILQKLDVNLVLGYQCQLKWRDRGGVDDNLLFSHICAEAAKAGHSTCRGDSGGPLATLADVQHDIWEMVGVVSFGVPRCGSVVAPLVFTRISGEVNLWLRDLIGHSLPQHP